MLEDSSMLADSSIIDSSALEDSSMMDTTINNSAVSAGDHGDVRIKCCCWQCFGSGSTWIRIKLVAWIHLKSWIRIRIKSVRIRNTGCLCQIRSFFAVKIEEPSSNPFNKMCELKINLRVGGVQLNKESHQKIYKISVLDSF
jgi:hypothetical protein